MQQKCCGSRMRDVLSVEPLRRLLAELQDGFEPQNMLDHPHAVAQNGTAGVCMAIAQLRSMRGMQGHAFFGELVKKLGKELSAEVVRWIVANSLHDDAAMLKELPLHYLLADDIGMLRLLAGRMEVSFRVQDFVQAAATISPTTLQEAWRWAQTGRSIEKESQLIQALAHHGRLDVFQQLFASRQMEEPQDGILREAIPSALASGHAGLADWLLHHVSTPVILNKSACIDPSALLYVIEQPLLRLGDARQSARESKASLLLESLDEVVVDTCCTRGDLRTLQWLLASGWHGTPFALKNAAAAGYVDAIKCLCASDAFKSNYYDTSQVMDSAILHGHIEVCEHLVERGFELGDPATAGKLAAQAKREPVAMLEWVARMGASFEQDAMDGSVASGRLESMQWLFARGLHRCQQVSVDVMCINAGLPEVKWVCEHLNQTLSPVALARLARNGQLDALMYAVDQGALPDAGVVQAAVQCHQHHILRWLQRRSPGLTEQVLQRIERRKRVPTRGLRSTQYALQERALQRRLGR